MSYADGAKYDLERVLFADLEENILLKSAHETHFAYAGKLYSATYESIEAEYFPQ